MKVENICKALCGNKIINKRLKHTHMVLRTNKTNKINICLPGSKELYIQYKNNFRIIFPFLDLIHEY